MKSKIWISISVVTVLYACSLTDLEPVIPNEKDIINNIRNVDDLQGIANGIYDRMTVTTYYGRNQIIHGEVRADNCFANGRSGRFMNEAAMKVSPDASNGPWDAMYAVIASCNIVIGQDPAKLTGGQQKIRQIMGQAYIARALAHFDLLKLYGQQHTGGNLGIPYIKEYVSGLTAPARNTINENRTAIFEDIETGLALMTEVNNPKTKQQVSTFTGQALKARVALYFKEWEKAKTASLAVINSGKFLIVDSANYVTSWKTKNNINSIFELANKHPPTKFRKISLWRAACHLHNRTENLANHRATGCFAPNSLRHFYTNRGEFSKKTLLEARCYCNVVFTLRSFNAYFLVWANPHHRIFFHAWLATFRGCSRRSRIFLVGQSNT